MNEIINVVQNVIDGETIQTVNARELHTYLGVGKVFAAWITERIVKYDFVDEIDYTTVLSSSGNNLGGRPSKDYHISLSMAKELAMVENNEQGKAARKYFIECEKRLNNTPKGIVLDNPMQLRAALLAYTETVIALENKVAEQVVLIEQQAPAVDFVDSFVKRGLNACLTDAWKGLGLKPKLFNKKLIEDGVLFKRVGGSANNAYQSHINAGHFVERFSEFGSQTLVTPKGILYIAKKYKKYISENSK